MDGIHHEYIRAIEDAALVAERVRDAKYQLGKLAESNGAECVREALQSWLNEPSIALLRNL